MGFERPDILFHSIGGFGYKDGTQYEQIGTDFHPSGGIILTGCDDRADIFGGRNAYTRITGHSPGSSGRCR